MAPRTSTVAVTLTSRLVSSTGVSMTQCGWYGYRALRLWGSVNTRWVGVGHVQNVSQTTLQPGVFGPGSALWAVAVATGVVLSVAVATGITGQLLAAQRSGAARDNAAPGLGLRSAQRVLMQVHAAPCWRSASARRVAMTALP